jgi:hypothetical protein
VTAASDRPSVQAARDGLGRYRVVIELAGEIDRMQQRDRARIERYLAASARYLDEFRRMRIDEMPLVEGHREACALAGRWLPAAPSGTEGDDADAQ